MRLIEVQAKLLALNQPIIQTADAAICLNISRTHASKILERLTQAGIILSLSRGLWSLSRTIDPLTLPEYLVAPYPSYISLQTALYYHEMISQIPAVTYAVSLARTRYYHTSVGVISIHHINADFLFDYTNVGNTNSNIKMATPEKALLDTLYLTPTRSLLFKALPELELSENFDVAKSFNMIQKITSARLRTIVTKKLATLIKKHSLRRSI